LIEVLGDQAPGQPEVDAIIMAARAHWFDDEPEPAEDEMAAAAAEAGDATQSGETTEA